MGCSEWSGEDGVGIVWVLPWFVREGARASVEDGMLREKFKKVGEVEGRGGVEVRFVGAFGGLEEPGAAL